MNHCGLQQHKNTSLTFKRKKKQGLMRAIGLGFGKEYLLTLQDVMKKESSA